LPKLNDARLIRNGHSGLADGTIDNGLTVAAIGMAFLGGYLQKDGS